MTQITRKSVPMRGLILLLTVTLGAGLVLSGCGDDDTATTPAPAPPPPPPPPAPEPEPEPEPPAPEAPATPTGLMVSETTETSITWTWDAVEGAIGYVVQANADEMWDATDTVTFEGLPFTTETTYTAMDLEPETAVFVRVAAAAGSLEAPLVSAFTTHVSGMSAMPPPEPEPMLDPVMVSFMIPDDADSMYAMMADDGTDEETAMAMVNPDIVVTSNTTALIVPMNFNEGAAPVKVHAGDDNMPFAFVSWMAMQSMVIEEGAIFKVMRITLGANQEEMPTGDVGYVTCGPFDCAEGMDAPDIMTSSAACDAWDPDFTLEVGLIDNDRQTHVSDRTKYVVGVVEAANTADDSIATPAEGVENTTSPFFCDTDGDGVETCTVNSAYEHAAAVECTDGSVEMGADGAKLTTVKDTKGNPTSLVVKCLDLRPTTIFDGLDLGWKYTSSLDFKVTHDLGSVNSGPRPSTTKAQSRSTALSVNSIGVVDLRRDPADTEVSADNLIESDYPRYAALAAEADVSFLDRFTEFRTDADTRGSCETVAAYDRTGQSRPKECFRLLVDGKLKQNYLDPYSFTADPQDADVSWGSIAWEAFEDLTCDSYSMMAADSVDVCSMLESEVDNLSMPKADPVVSSDNKLIGFNLTYGGIGGPGDGLRGLWYDHPTSPRLNPNGNLYDQNHRIDPNTGETSDYNPYDERTASSPASGAKHVQTVALVATDSQDPPVRKSDEADMVKETWIKTLLRNDFPNPDYGDLGKTDTDGNSYPNNHGNNARTSDDTCSGADGGQTQTGRPPGSFGDAVGDGNSTLCDAADVELSTSVTFVDGMDLGCSTTVEYTLTCQWDASGGHTATAAGEFTDATAKSFVRCSVE